MNDHIQKTIEDMTRALEVIEEKMAGKGDHLSDIKLVLERQFDESVKVIWKAFTLQSGHFEAISLEAMIEQARNFDPKQKDRERAAQLREQAQRFLDDAAKLEAAPEKLT